MNCKRILFCIFFINLFLFYTTSFSKDIPVIVIAPGKTLQSYSTVGSAVSVVGNKMIENSQNFFLSDVLNNNSTGINLFQMGGHGTNTGIQAHWKPFLPYLWEVYTTGFQHLEWDWKQAPELKEIHFCIIMWGLNIISRNSCSSGLVLPILSSLL